MASLVADREGLRQRNTSIHFKSEEDARQAVLELNALEERTMNGREKKTFGRTPDGTVFTVPITHDMVSQLLSPAEPKNVSDGLVICVLLLHISAFWILPGTIRVLILGAIFFFWRAGYNLGIGWLLHKQSHQRTLVRWASKSKLFGNSDDCDRPRLRAFIKRELEIKIPENYQFDTAPLEYNTWLVFRRIVDLVLMCDFTSYILFAIACGRRPIGESLIITIARWTFGVVLFVFNLWIKLDAHRVVKDYAWYWGDFFYLVDQELTFDGVFEMAPHPMYSIGYIGYYGISIMAASYKVLFVSIIAHAAQFAFLVWVENPHIERTYNAPPPRRQINNLPKAATGKPAINRTDTAEAWPNPVSDQPPATHNLLGIHNMDLYRTTDSSVLIILFFMLSLTLLAPNTPTIKAFFVINAAIWRLWFSVGLGYLLNRQSEKKKWTRHFVKYGESTGEAWRQWKGTYHMSMVLCYASFAAACWKMYTLPPNWEYGLVLLKHVVGSSLVALQIWVSVSIYDSLGEFGWFFGDFFFDHSPKLTYSGIYRFLNNPERVLGLAGTWGLALVSDSAAMLILAFISHTLSLLFIQFVERPHMQKLYGQSLRQDAGLVRSIRRSLPPPLRQWQDGIDKVISETLDVVDDYLDAAKPKLAANVSAFVNDTKQLFRAYPASIAVKSVVSDTIDFDTHNYAINIIGERASALTVQQRSGTEKLSDTKIDTDNNQDGQTIVLEYGAPIKVKWTAPINHSKLDWIALYQIADNSSREVTRVPSAGRWIATNFGEYDTLAAERGLIKSDIKHTITENDSNQTECVTGEMIFSGDKLWWIQGTYEFRYHHNGKHKVLAISLPFEVRIPRFNDDNLNLDPVVVAQQQNDLPTRQTIETHLLPLIQNCFDRDPNIAPTTPQETFGALVERDGKFARRVVYAVHQMFGVEFAPEVVKADGKVENLAWRIWEAKKVLAPYSMSQSPQGVITPVEDEM